MEESKGFLRIFAVVTVFSLVIVATVNLITDPFRLFRFPEIAGFNAAKPVYGKSARMIKAHEIRVIKPKGLILGSSRAEYGLDPEHPGWDDESRPVFNLALPSGSITEAFLYLQHAHAIQAIQQVVLALDFFMFNANWQTNPDFSIGRLVIPSQSALKLGWQRDLVTALVSYDALSASYNTIARQREADLVPYLSNGARHATRNWERIKTKGGHHKAFVSNEHYSLTADDGWQYFSLFGEDGVSLPTVQVFKEIVEFCRHNRIDLRILIPPIHARKLEVKRQFGLWPRFEQWKRELVAVLTADGVSHPDHLPFILWDFSGYNSITTETVPPLNDIKTKMHWYWEGSHYKKITGDLALDRIFSSAGKELNDRVDFGGPLTVANIEKHLQSIRRAQQRYIASHPNDVQEIKTLIVETADKRVALQSLQIAN